LHWQIYTLPFPSSGATPTPVTSGNANGIAPVFSPDPTNMKIAYSGFDGSNYQIYTIPTGGGTPTPLTSGDGSYHPDFSPDGATIVYYSLDSSNKRQLYTIPSVPPSVGGTATPTQLTNDATNHQDPAFSPNGTKIVYEDFNGNLLTIPFPSSGATGTPVTGKKGGFYPNWGVSTRR
jgi:Tol biopolymer transport system component